MIQGFEEQIHQIIASTYKMPVLYPFVGLNTKQVFWYNFLTLNFILLNICYSDRNKIISFMNGSSLTNLITNFSSSTKKETNHFLVETYDQTLKLYNNAFDAHKLAKQTCFSCFICRVCIVHC